MLDLASLRWPPRRRSRTSAARLFAIVVLACACGDREIPPSTPISPPSPSTPAKTDAATPTNSAAEFSAGECIMAKDGYIWRITRIERGRYFSMGWQRTGWGNETSFEIGHFEKLGYRSSPCPEVRPQ